MIVLFFMCKHHYTYSNAEIFAWTISNQFTKKNFQNGWVTYNTWLVEYEIERIGFLRLFSTRRQKFEGKSCNYESLNIAKGVISNQDYNFSSDIYIFSCSGRTPLTIKKKIYWNFNLEVILISSIYLLSIKFKLKESIKENSAFSLPIFVSNNFYVLFYVDTEIWTYFRLKTWVLRVSKQMLPFPTRNISLIDCRLSFADFGIRWKAIVRCSGSLHR